MTETEPLPTESPSTAAPTTSADASSAAASGAAAASSTTGNAAAPEAAADEHHPTSAEVAGPAPLVPTAPAAEAAPREPGLSPAQTAARLAELFPALFGGPPKPIKLRIQSDIQQRAPGVFTKRVMSIVLSRHTTTTPYLKALVTQTQRFDLDGQAAGEIAPEHKQAAVDELARRRQIVEQRRAAERAARGQRPSAGPQHRTAAEATPGPQDNAQNPAGERQPGPARRDHQRRQAAGMATNRPPRRAGPQDPRPGSRSEARPPSPRGQPPQRANRPPLAQRSDHRAARQETPTPRDWTTADPAQRERALLLRAWESSSLTKANFCALKRLTEAEFDAQLDQARQERSAARSS